MTDDTDRPRPANWLARRRVPLRRLRRQLYPPTALAVVGASALDAVNPWLLVVVLTDGLSLLATDPADFTRPPPPPEHAP